MYPDDTIGPKKRVLQAVTRPGGYSRVVNENKVTNLQTGGSPQAILSVQFTFRNVSQVNFCLVT